jgi:hypothetical protein
MNDKQINIFGQGSNCLYPTGVTYRLAPTTDAFPAATMGTGVASVE